MNIKKLMLLSALTLLATTKICTESQDDLRIQKITSAPKSKPQKLGANPYTYSPILFTADNDVMGRYWAGNKEYPAKAFIGDVEYASIVVIKKSQVNLKSKKKLRKNKDYLGTYVDAATNIAYNLYGAEKYPAKVNDAPDADVITMIAIKEDYGIGE